MPETRVLNFTVSELQIETLERMLKIAKGSHWIDITMRANGENFAFQADWLKNAVLEA